MRRFMLVILFLLPSTLLAQDQAAWEKGFLNPPPECRPEVFFDFMGGLISKEGLTKDLEAMQQAGSAAS